MFQNFIISVQAVLPLFFMMLLGVFIRKMKWLNEQELTRLNGVIFKVLLPFAVFTSIYRTDLSETLHLRLIAFAVGAVLLTFLTALYIVPKIEPSNATRGAMIQASYRSNFVLLGLPLVSNIYPNANLGLTAIAIAVLIPVYNVLAVLTLEYYRGGRANPKRIVRSILTNPLILGCLAGLLAIPFQLPSVIDHTVTQISATATPMALIMLGASFQFNPNLHQRLNVTLCTINRLILVPGIFLSIAALLGFRGLAFATLIGILGTPCSISSFTMVQQMESDADLAGAAVVCTSILSCVTMCFWIFLFKHLGVL